MDLSRQSMIMQGFLPEEWKVLVVGAGGIGSNAVYMLASMGFEQITVYEPDSVEEANIAPQFYGYNDLYGEEGGTFSPVPKTSALWHRIMDLTRVKLTVVSERYLRQREEANIVVIAVDDIATRRRIWQQHRIKDVQWWIDGRMGGTLCSVYAVDMTSERAMAKYKASLDVTPDPLPCGLKSTAFITKGTIQGMIGKAIFHIVNGTGYVPYFQLDDAMTMTNIVQGQED